MSGRLLTVLGRSAEPGSSGGTHTDPVLAQSPGGRGVEPGQPRPPGHPAHGHAQVRRRQAGAAPYTAVPEPGKGLVQPDHDRGRSVLWDVQENRTEL